MKHDIYRWIFRIPLSDVDSTGNDMSKTTGDQCLLCGKKIKTVRQYVHLTIGLDLISTDEDVDDSQGFFPVGNECKNKLPNNFIFNYYSFNKD